jgi:hypothetical protein
MTKSSSKKGGGAKSSKKVPDSLSLMSLLDPHRAGMPSRDSITGVTLASPSTSTGAEADAVGIQYRIIQTNELDEYEKGAASAEDFADAVADAPTGDNFEGTARKAAKLSIANAKTEKFTDLKNLIKSLTPDDEMRDHAPKIGTGAKSGRVEEEQRNVRVNAFIYAASRESDNDFHLIIGRDPNKTPEMYMTMELSGLPPSSSASFAKLNAARDAYKTFYNENLGGNLPGLKYSFYDPPIPVTIDGSLFFDMSHAKGQAPGPKSLKSRMPTIWEVHPIIKMVF